MIAFNAMRVKEGNHLIEDMSVRIKTITKNLIEVKKQSDGTVKKEFDKLFKRIDDLLDSNKIDRDKREKSPPPQRY